MKKKARSAPPADTRIAFFQKKEIRKTIHANERWLVLTDVVAALTDPANPAGYPRALYKAKGYSDARVERRMRSIAIRDELTGTTDAQGLPASKDAAHEGCHRGWQRPPRTGAKIQPQSHEPRKLPRRLRCLETSRARRIKPEPLTCVSYVPWAINP